MKYKIFTTINLLISTIGLKAETLPKSFSDFNVYASQDIVYAKSDIQGIVGAKNSITFSSFSVLDDREQLGFFENPFNYSVFTNTFALINGSISDGGVYSRDKAFIKYASIDGNVASNSAKIQSSSYGYIKKPKYLNFDLITQSMHDYSNSILAKTNYIKNEYESGGYTVLKANDHNGKLENVFKLDKMTNLVIDSNGDDREYFIIRNDSEEISMSYLDIKLKGDVSPNKILFFFPNAKNVRITASGVSTEDGYEARIGVPGTVLAPNAKIVFYNGLITGAVYAKELVGRDGIYPGGQINFGKFVCLEYKNCLSTSDTYYE